VKVDLDCILVVDVESTCWEGQPSPGETSEIIQIGACFLDTETTLVTGSTSILVKPKVSKVSDFCLKLTGITQEMLDTKGISYGEAVGILVKALNSKKKTWASYGDYDKYMFEKMSGGDRKLYPFGARHINVKNLFALKCKLDKEIGMMGALGKLGLKLEGRHHDAKDDVINIAKILSRILW